MFAKQQKRKHFPRKKKTAAPKIRKSHQWDNNQRAVFDDVANGQGNTIVASVPGSGKTDVQCESLYYIPEEYRTNRRTLMTAYSVAIAETLESRVPSEIAVKTTHGLGFGTVRKNWGTLYGITGPKNVDKENDALFDLVQKIIGKEESKVKLAQNIVQAVELSKTTLADNNDAIRNLLDDHGIELCNLSSEEFASIVFQIMNITSKQPLMLNGHYAISFTDMLWLPHVNGWMPEQYDRVGIDEYQDFSAARTELVLKAVAEGGRVLATGDPYQGIFGWAGADSKALANFTKDLNAKTLPLSVSYRCPKAIVELAKKVNPSIQASPFAIDGCINTFDTDNIFNVLKPGYVVLSRTNYPLIKLCFALLARGIKANIMGKDIAKRYFWRIDRCWQPATVNNLQKSIKEWHEEVVMRLIEKNRPSTTIDDEYESLMSFTYKASTVSEVKNRIQSFFSDDDSAQIKLSTAHKFKGLEKDNVVMLNKTFHPERGGEEANVWYVATTRTRNYLGFAEGSI